MGGRIGNPAALIPAARVVTLGEALVAISPERPGGLEEATALRICVGGAEVNFAVSLARLGIAATWVGRLDPGPLGRRVAADLLGNGVEAVVRPTDRPTGLYLREWLPDGERRPYYYRTGAAGTALTPADWPLDLEAVAWVHLTGITPALGPGPAAAVNAALEWALSAGVPVSFDPNYRPALWNPYAAAMALKPLAARADVVLAGDGELDLLFDTSDPAVAIERALAGGVRCCVVKLGDRGAMAGEGEERVEVGAAPASSVDPVGAGDAFDAGFVAARLRGAGLRGSLELAAYCGARAVESPTEHDSAVTLRELPEDLSELLRPG